MELTIEKDIPLAPRERSSGFSKTLREMQVGDSFECPFLHGRRQGLYSVAKRAGVKIAIRKKNETMRVWRVE